MPHDLQAAFYWIKQAADQGDSKAQNSMGLLYADGQGTHQDDQAAAFWFRKAADQGNVRAQHSLSRLYFQGNGVPKDYVQAYRWLYLADSGSKDSEETSVRKSIVDALAFVGGHMSAEQIAEAQGLAREWKPKPAAQSINEAAFAAARAWQQSDVVLAAYASLLPDKWQGRQSFEGGEIFFPDAERARALLTEATEATSAGRDAVRIIKLFDESLKLDYSAAVDDEDFLELRAKAYLAAGRNEPDRARELFCTGLVLAQRQHWREAAIVYRASADLDPLCVWHLNNLSWMAATSTEPRVRDGRYAVVLAVEACEISGWGCSSFLGTLAAAFARAGDFQRAAAWQRICLKLSPPERSNEEAERLRQFEAGEAYTDLSARPQDEDKTTKAAIAQIDIAQLLSRAEELIGPSHRIVQ